jgi:hypothetical protein
MGNVKATVGEHVARGSGEGRATVIGIRNVRNALSADHEIGFGLRERKCEEKTKKEEKLAVIMKAGKPGKDITGTLFGMF